MLFRFVLPVALLCFYFADLGKLQPPRPRPGEAGQENQKRAEAADAPRPGKNGHSSESPLVLQKRTPPENEWPHDYQSAKGNQESSKDWWTPVSVFVNLLFTAALVATAIIQCRMMYLHHITMEHEMQATRAGAKAAEDAAQAAIAAVDHARLEQRAWLACREFKITPIEQGPVGLQMPVYNSGRTPAFVTGHSTYWKICEEANISAEFKVALATCLDLIQTSGVTVRTVIPPDSSLTLNVDPWGANALDPSVVSAINAHSVVLIFAIVVIYQDVFDGIHETRMCYIYQPIKRNFMAHHDGNKMS